jgi:hypothetical protein
VSLVFGVAIEDAVVGDEAVAALVRIPLIVNASSGIVNSDSADRDHAVGAKRR